jgi:prepilin signal peptidase PulO-like enzyme (type II secretory pathway)
VQAGLDPTTGVRVLSYVLTALVAAACLAGYATTQRWPLLAVGVLATAVVVPEVLSEWLGDSLGIPGLLLASGVTLLGASLLGLRMGRRGAPRPDEVTAGSTPPR